MPLKDFKDLTGISEALAGGDLDGFEPSEQLSTMEADSSSLKLLRRESIILRNYYEERGGQRPEGGLRAPSIISLGVVTPSYPSAIVERAPPLASKFKSRGEKARGSKRSN